MITSMKTGIINSNHENPVGSLNISIFTTNFTQYADLVASPSGPTIASCRGPSDEERFALLNQYARISVRD